jgi:hypothetical protein
MIKIIWRFIKYYIKRAEVQMYFIVKAMKLNAKK